MSLELTTIAERCTDYPTDAASSASTALESNRKSKTGDGNEQRPFSCSGNNSDTATSETEGEYETSSEGPHRATQWKRSNETAMVSTTSVASIEEESTRRIDEIRDDNSQKEKSPRRFPCVRKVFGIPSTLAKSESMPVLNRTSSKEKEAEENVTSIDATLTSESSLACRKKMKMIVARMTQFFPSDSTFTMEMSVSASKTDLRSDTYDEKKDASGTTALPVPQGTTEDQPTNRTNEVTSREVYGEVYGEAYDEDYDEANGRHGRKNSFPPGDEDNASCWSATKIHQEPREFRENDDLIDIAKNPHPSIKSLYFPPSPWESDDDPRARSRKHSRVSNDLEALLRIDGEFGPLRHQLSEITGKFRALNLAGMIPLVDVGVSSLFSRHKCSDLWRTSPPPPPPSVTGSEQFLRETDKFAGGRPASDDFARLVDVTASRGTPFALANKSVCGLDGEANYVDNGGCPFDRRSFHSEIDERRTVTSNRRAVTTVVANSSGHSRVDGESGYSLVNAMGASSRFEGVPLWNRGNWFVGKKERKVSGVKHSVPSDVSGVNLKNSHAKVSARCKGRHRLDGVNLAGTSIGETPVRIGCRRCRRNEATNLPCPEGEFDLGKPLYPSALNDAAIDVREETAGSRRECGRLGKGGKPTGRVRVSIREMPRVRAEETSDYRRRDCTDISCQSLSVESVKLGRDSRPCELDPSKRGSRHSDKKVAGEPIPNVDSASSSGTRGNEIVPDVSVSVIGVDTADVGDAGGKRYASRGVSPISRRSLMDTRVTASRTSQSRQCSLTVDDAPSPSGKGDSRSRLVVAGTPCRSVLDISISSKSLVSVGKSKGESEEKSEGNGANYVSSDKQTSSLAILTKNGDVSATVPTTDDVEGSPSNILAPVCEDSTAKHDGGTSSETKKDLEARRRSGSQNLGYRRDEIALERSVESLLPRSSGSDESNALKSGSGRTGSIRLPKGEEKIIIVPVIFTDGIPSPTRVPLFSFARGEPVSKPSHRVVKLRARKTRRNDSWLSESSGESLARLPRESSAHGARRWDISEMSISRLDRSGSSIRVKNSCLSSNTGESSVTECRIDKRILATISGKSHGKKSHSESVDPKHQKKKKVICGMRSSPEDFLCDT